MLRYILLLGICALTWFAAIAKLVGFDYWLTFVNKEVGWGGMALACCVPAFEIVAPLGLFPRNRFVTGLASLALTAFYAICAAFHALRLGAGRLTPCSCFGPVFSLSPVTMFWLCVGAAIVSALSATWLLDAIARCYAKGNRKEQNVFVLGVCTLGGAIAYRMCLTGNDVRRPLMSLEPTGSTNARVGDDMGGIVTASTGGATKHLVAVVDPKCPYSVALLHSLNSYSPGTSVDLTIIFEPVLSTKESYSQSLVAIAGMLGSRNPRLSPKAFDAACIRKQEAFCRRFGWGHVPMLLGFTDGSVVRLETGSNVIRAIDRFSKVNLGGDRT